MFLYQYSCHELRHDSEISKSRFGIESLLFFAAHLNVVVVAILLYCSWRLATCQLSKLVKANRTKFEKDSGEELGGNTQADTCCCRRSN